MVVVGYAVCEPFMVCEALLVTEAAVVPEALVHPDMPVDSLSAVKAVTEALLGVKPAVKTSAGKAMAADPVPAAKGDRFKLCPGNRGRGLRRDGRYRRQGAGTEAGGQKGGETQLGHSTSPKVWAGIGPS